MTTRNEMLKKVRDALQDHSGEGSSAQRLAAIPETGPVMPAILPEELVDRFEGELQRVAGVARRAVSLAALDEILQEILSKHEAGPVVLSRNPLLVQVGLPERLTAWGKPFTVWPREATASAASDFRARCFEAKIGFTGVEFALAESGTLVLSSLTEGNQLASLAPPVHVALIRRAQVVESLEEVLARLPVPRDPGQPLPGRSVVFVTGPSRTADIEQISIRGVHGPTYVYAILLEDSCFS
ncbi:MAG TPA: lactate utilization protein [Terriglobia bacterium]|nr:lactate utilization protein [Terriglobia bacterium]